MKISTFLLTLAFVSSTSAFASAPDNATTPVAVKPVLSPDVDVLYFNQVTEFTLTAGTGYVVDHVEFTNGTSMIDSNGFKLVVDYSNGEEADGELQVYVRDAAGTVRLAYDKQITLKQKLSVKNDESVRNDKNIFELDGNIIELRNSGLKEKLLNATRLNVNPDRFDQDSIALHSFDMEISTGTGKRILHSATGEITSEMKAAINELNDGDSVSFINIAATYIANKQVVKMNLNYVIGYRIDALG